MGTVDINHISKRFGAVQAVHDVSFEVAPGEIFGLLGPNGAGKTTIIRMILDIFRPDSGTIQVLGGPMEEAKKDKIGYLPEERGLYQDISLERCIRYLASLKGMNEPQIGRQIEKYLQRFDLQGWRKKKVKELSKGMQQKAQLITALIHNPDLIVIDEPFSALDPVNTQLVKEILLEERSAGKTVVMCTHQMHQVEELADRLVLISRGEVLLYGGLLDVRKQFAKPELHIISGSRIPAVLTGVAEIISLNQQHSLKLLPETDPQQVLRELVQRDVRIESFEVAMPTLDEIFIEVVKDQNFEALTMPSESAAA